MTESMSNHLQKRIKNSLTFFSAGFFLQKKKKMMRDWVICPFGSHRVSSIMGFLSRVSKWKSNQFVVWFHLTWMPNVFSLFAQLTNTEKKHTTHAKDISCWFLNTFRLWSITMVGQKNQRRSFTTWKILYNNFFFLPFEQRSQKSLLGIVWNMLSYRKMDDKCQHNNNKS